MTSRAPVTPIGRFLRRARIVWTYRDGDATRFVWLYWNPLSWVCALLAVLYVFLCEGLSGLVHVWREPHLYGFGVDPYFAEKGIPVEWDRADGTPIGKVSS